MCVRILKVNFTTHKRKICCCRQFYLALVASQPTSLPALVACLLAAAADVVVVFALFLAHSAFWFSLCVCVCVRLTLHARVGSAAFLTAAAGVAVAATAALIARIHWQKAAQFVVALSE